MEEKVSFEGQSSKTWNITFNMVMPNIGLFIAWGVLTALFIPDGYLPNEQLAAIVAPMLTYLLPTLIGYTGGYVIYGQRWCRRRGYCYCWCNYRFQCSNVYRSYGNGDHWEDGHIKKFDEKFQEKIRPGFEMLVNNFSAGLVGFALLLLAFYAIGPVVSTLTGAVGNGVEAIVNAKLLPLANIIIEPAKVLFLNNALNHGIFTPSGS